MRKRTERTDRRAELQDVRAALAECARENARKALAQGEPGVRKMARSHLDTGACFLIAAFNLASDPAKPYAYPAEVRERVQELLQELIALHRSPLVVRQAPFAASDPAFQRLMAGVVPKGAP